MSFAIWHQITYLMQMGILEILHVADATRDRGAGIRCGADKRRPRPRRCFARRSTCSGLWGVSDEQAAALLDLPLRTYRRWKADGPGRIGRDGAARLSNLMGIHKALRLIFSDPQRGYAWIKAPNAAFGGRSALAVMLGGELTDLMRVRRYLDAERGGW